MQKAQIDFDFHNAHDLNKLRDTSSDDQIKRKLRERMKNSKQAIVLVGEHTKNLYKFIRWEIMIAFDLDLPIIAVNLDKKNCRTNRTPPVLTDRCYFVSVPFEIDKIKYALDNFPKHYHKNKSNAPADLYYDWETCQLRQRCQRRST